MGSVVLVGWPASDQGIQCEWSIQHLFHSLKKLTPGGDDDTLQLSDLSHREIQRRARSLNENLIGINIEIMLFFVCFGEKYHHLRNEFSLAQNFAAQETGR